LRSALTGRLFPYTTLFRSIQAAKLGKKVVITEKNNVLGGATINTGTIPSKALREAVMHLTGHSKRGIFGESYRVKRNITIADISDRKSTRLNSSHRTISYA